MLFFVSAYLYRLHINRLKKGGEKRETKGFKGDECSVLLSEKINCA